MLVAMVVGQSAPALPALQNFTFDLGENASVEGGKVPLFNGRWKDPAEGGSTFNLLPVARRWRSGWRWHCRRCSRAGRGVNGNRDVCLSVRAEESRRDGSRSLGPPEWLGDRSIVERLAIDRQGILSVRFLTHKDGDPECCPTLRVNDRFRVERGKLVGMTK